jgi:hypothetical protein
MLHKIPLLKTIPEKINHFFEKDGYNVEKCFVLEKSYLCETMPGVHRDLLEGRIKDLLNMGIIKPSKSRYNIVLFTVPKMDGSLRIVQDFRQLNSQSKDDRYSIKDINTCVGDNGNTASYHLRSD